MRTPKFWYGNKDKDKPAWMDALSPIGELYAWTGRMRERLVKPSRTVIPVICIGNLTAGGTGKTPITLTIAQRLKEMGESPVILSKGYGGSHDGPIKVNPELNTAAEVGDEPLLLARQVATVIAKDRVKGAAFAQRNGASVIVMDDGFQNPTLEKDLSILVIDAVAGFGNRKVIPAGPLREKITDGLARADIIILMHGEEEDDPDIQTQIATPVRPIFHASLKPHDNEEAARQRVIAFSGIGRPEKFFATVEACGYKLVASHGFPDHHAFSESEIEDLRRQAQRDKATLITTEKDMMRLTRVQRRQINVLKVRAEIDDMTALMDRINRTIQSFRTRP